MLLQAFCPIPAPSKLPVSPSEGSLGFDEALDHLSAGIPHCPGESPESTLRALWLTAAGHPSSDRAPWQAMPDLDPQAQVRLKVLIEKRRLGFPLPHLTGRQRFMDVELLVGPEAMLPRQETELLARTALQKAEGLGRNRSRLRALDLCTGSGNLAVVLAKAAPGFRVYAGDLSSPAVDLARRNAATQGVEDRVLVLQGDLFEPFETRSLWHSMDLILCNPPCMSSTKVASRVADLCRFEPQLAFDGGRYGLEILLRLVRDAIRFLAPESWLCFEVGPGQGPYMAKQLERSGLYAEVERIPDASGEIRVLAARSP